MSIYNEILKAIEDELDKCSKPKYIQDLPVDLRSNDQTLLGERLDALQKMEDEAREEYDEKYDEYEKAKETEKNERDEIKKMTDTIVDTIDGIYAQLEEEGWNRDSLDGETYEVYDDETGETYDEEDTDLIQWNQDFYDNFTALHNEIHDFQQAIYDRLDGDENANTLFTRIENLIDWSTYPLTDGGVGVYLDDSITRDMQSIQRTYINRLNTTQQWDKWETASQSVNDIEKELEEIREKQNTLRGESDRTMQKLSE